MSFIVNNRIHVNPSFEDDFELRFRARAGQSDRQPGFVAMRVLRPQGDQAPYMVETEWESQQAFRDWVGSNDVKRAHADPLPPDATAESDGIEQFEVVEGTVAGYR